jgi:hypothetical protein
MMKVAMILIAVNSNFLFSCKQITRKEQEKEIVDEYEKNHNHIYFAPNFSAIGTEGTTT